MKRCSKCGIDKPLGQFAKRTDRPSGVQSRCKDCQRSKACADCGKPVTRYATYCLDCRSKGERNAMHGTVRPQSVRDAVSAAQRGAPEPPRPVKRPTTPASGRSQANLLYAKPKHCERCGEFKALDWHHVDGDPTNNRRDNLRALCRRCHQIEDGRHEFLATDFPKMGGKAVHARTSR